MLLDEPPCRHYMQGSMCGQPWRHNSPLVAAMRTAQLSSHAWLYIVYRGDPVLSWGSKTVKVVSGGKIYVELKTRYGTATGELRELRYRNIAPQVFRPIYGTTQTGGTYKVIIKCSLEFDPDADVQIGEPHPLLGYKELRLEGKIAKEFSGDGNGGKDTRTVPRNMGCFVEWINEKGYGETWFLQDGDGLDFELTEYQRRVYVQYVLEQLGYVHGESHTSRQQLRGHIKNVTESLTAIAVLIDTREDNLENSRKEFQSDRQVSETRSA